MKENWNKFKCHRGKVFLEEWKKFVVNKVLLIMSYENVKGHALGHLRAATYALDYLMVALR